MDLRNILTATKQFSRRAIFYGLFLTLPVSYCGKDEESGGLSPDTGIHSGSSTLRDYDLTSEDPIYAFDFSQGKEITETGPTGDFVFDDGNLGGEIFQVPEWVFLVIRDMGTVSLESITQAPESGYTYGANNILNHAYCIKTMEGNYAKMKVKSVNVDRMSFDWVYQGNGSRNF